jgi:EAL domain-containing protein (putative c-di-GMP-specific phosphodiesterase class I)
MGLETIPEGVETPEQAAWIAGRGIRRAQGFLWGRPQPPAELEGWLTTTPRGED